jgi:hypothetical protein
MNVYYEIIGYAGTALVLVSFMMTSVTKLRWFNLAGAVLSTIYALLTNAMPVLILNASLILINGIQLYRLARQKKEETE